MIFKLISRGSDYAPSFFFFVFRFFVFLSFFWGGRLQVYGVV